MRPNGSKGRGESGSRVWEKRKASAFAGPITKSADGVTFLVLRKQAKGAGVLPLGPRRGAAVTGTAK